jgi:hypothetical protein
MTLHVNFSATRGAIAQPEGNMIGMYVDVK